MRVRVEHLEQPVGIGDRRPRLSWQLPEGAGDQFAYELRLDDGTSTGRVDSPQNVLVPWPGGTLSARERRRVQVRVWTDRGESPWSEPTALEAGLLEPANWVSSWVTPAEPAGHRPGFRPAYLLRGEAHVDRRGPGRGRARCRALVRGPAAGTAGPVAQRQQAADRAPRPVRRPDHRRDGQAGHRGPRRGRQVRRELRGRRRSGSAVARRPRGAQRRSSLLAELRAARRGVRRDAVELPVVAGVAVRRRGARGGKRGGAQARAERDRLRSGHPGPLRRRRRPRRRVPITGRRGAGRPGGHIPDHPRPPRRSRHSHRQRTRRHRGRVGRGRRAEEVRPRARRLRPVRRAGRRRPPGRRRGGRPVPVRQRRPELHRGQALHRRRERRGRVRPALCRTDRDAAGRRPRGSGHHDRADGAGRPARRPARAGPPYRRRGRRPGRRRPPDRRARSLLRADPARPRHAGHDGVRRGDLRPGRGSRACPRRRPRRRARQRDRVRARRVGVEPFGARPRGRQADPFGCPVRQHPAHVLQGHLGLTEVGTDGDLSYLAAEGSPEQYVVRLRKATDKRLDLIAFGAENAAAVDALAARLGAQGVQVVSQPGPLQTAGGGYGFRFFDVDGRTIEVSSGVRTRPHRAIEEGEAIPVRISHAVMNSGDINRTREFYERHLGFKLTDSLWSQHMGEMMHFMRCNDWHHSLALAKGPHTSVHHVSFEMRGLDEYMRGTGRVMRAGIRKVWGPGRHLAGNNTFSYFIDPSGNTMEYTTELERLETDQWHPSVYDIADPMTQDQWGTADPMSELIAKESFNDPDRGVFVAPPV